MGKKLMVFALAAIMMLGVFGLVACNNVSLVDYKVAAITAIESHAKTMKTENDYTAEGYAAIEDAVEAGKQAVNAAKTKTAVNTERDKTIQVISNVPKEDELEMAEILKQFDLTDQKESWNGSFGDIDFNFPVTIFITFRLLKDDAVYPELELRHLNHANIKSFGYLFLTKPDTWLGDPLIHEELFRQCGGIELIDSSRNAVEEMIRHLEGLEFIKRVSPEGTAFPTGPNTTEPNI